MKVTESMMLTDVREEVDLTLLDTLAISIGNAMSRLVKGSINVFVNVISVCEL